MSYYRAIYKVKNPDKYLGSVDTNSWQLTSRAPHTRSSWEYRVCTWCDSNVNVLQWGFECILIPYIGMDNRRHKYIVDFYVEVRKRDGNIGKQLWEVKPLKDGPTIVNGKWSFLNRPTPPKRKSKKAMKNYMYSMRQYITNCKKWKAVECFCKVRGMEFKVVTENDVF